MKTIFHAMEEKMLQQFIESKKELLEAAASMSAKERAEGRKEIMESAVIFDVQDGDEHGDLFTVDADGVAFIPIRGKLTNQVDICDGFFSDVTTYGFIQAAAVAADNDPSVNKIKFDISSGGGHVTGVDVCGQILANINKPTEGIVSGMCASAAFWLASQLDEITVTAPTDFVGSIGVAIEFIDVKARDEARGVKRVILTSTDAPDKRVNLDTLEGQAKLVEELDAIHNVFASRVSVGRKVSIEKINKDFGQGGVVIAAEAKKAGMIDNIQNEIKNNGEDRKISSDSDTNNPPAKAGKPNKEEVQEMDLKTLLAENPAAQAQYDANVKLAADTARTEGETAGKEKMQATIKEVSPFIGNAEYPAVIGTTALKILNGEESMITLKASVAAVDAVKEQSATTAAVAETTETGDTVATGPTTDAEKAQSDYDAKKKRLGEV